jgi:DNA (cytosine-5)-methyltransferase 1
MNNSAAAVTLGSLFDGIGAVPLAGSCFGITPVWASEIMPNAISVTKRHFPGMEHVGDITALDGAKLPPVQVIAFGSPCQSWSVAGTRTGFEGKSGLFMEAIRIIREMRCATHGKSPEIVLFENVPGLMSGGKGSYAGRDYQAVLEAFTEAEIPMPESGRWANAGMVRGRGIDLAWVIRDAQYHRTAQRRRRLFVVVDFAGRRAGEILFIQQSLSGYFAARESERQGVTADAEGRAGGEGGGTAGRRTGSENDGVSVVGAFMAGQAKNARSLAYNESVSPTLKGSPSGLNQIPCVVEPSQGSREAVRLRGRRRDNGADELSPSGGSEFSVVYPDAARTLTARGDGSPNVDGGPNIVAIHQNQAGELRASEVAYTLGTNANASGRNAPLIAFAQNERDEVRGLNDVAGCLAANPGMKQQTYIVQSAANCLTPWDTQQARIHTPDGTSPTLASADGGGGRRPGGLVITEAHPAVAGTLCASGAGLNRPGGQGAETDLCVAYSLQSNMIGRQDHNGPQGGGVNEKKSFTLGAADRHAVAAIDCRNLYENTEVSGTSQSKSTGGHSLNYINPVRAGYVIRRLTPTEAERLMSLPDGWTAYGHDGKVMSDSARYQMCGNSIVVNVLAPILQNIADYLRRETDGHV